VSVWFVIPSKRPVDEADGCLEAWQKQGYRTAVLREWDDGQTSAEMQFHCTRYRGWATSVNYLVQSIDMVFDDAEWFVTGGDDYYPDLNYTADEIAEQCREHFMRTPLHEIAAPTFGVMQPTGDRWGSQSCPACRGSGKRFTIAWAENCDPCVSCDGTGLQATIDRIAGSPWMGREFCRRMYHGGGPLYNGYFHNFADEELQNVAQKLGVFQQRRDLIQEHRHWARPRGDVRDMPDWAAKINDPRLSDWDKSKALFLKRKAAGFPGHEPLEV
jgi:hypothetical protein